MHTMLHMLLGFMVLRFHIGYRVLLHFVLKLLGGWCLDIVALAHRIGDGICFSFFTDAKRYTVLQV